MRRLGGLGVVLAGTLALAGCGSADTGPALSASGAYMPQPVSDSMAAGYLVITNKGGTKDELTSVTSDAGSVTVHKTSGGSMEQADSLDVPAHGKLVFSSGGNHLMFEKLKRKPVRGEKVSVTLHFAESGDIRVEMPVQSATYTPKTGN